MSTIEEDVELRDLVSQTLEKNGCLAKLRAELRASIFLALDEDLKLSKHQPLQNLRVQSYLETAEGRIMFCLVREFLEFFNLQFTISVYEPESYLDSIYHYEGRQKTARDLGLGNIEESTVPLLQHLLKIAQAGNNVLDINLNLDNNISGSFKDESVDINSSYKKTEMDGNSPTITSNTTQTQKKLNSTFDVNALDSHISKHTRHTNEVKSNAPETVKEKNFKDSSSAVDSNISNSNNTRNLNDLKLINVEHVTDELGKKKFNLDETFEVNIPDNNHIDINKSNDNNANLKIHQTVNEDDTYEDTSSIAEDSENGIYSSLKVTEMAVNLVPRSDLNVNNINESITLSKAKIEIEKTKYVPQRPKTIGCHVELPPLPVSNKTKLKNQILPSLYNKDFKDKTNLKELDKLFHMEAEYEEDFMCNNSNEISISNSSIPSVESKNSLSIHVKSEVSSVIDEPHTSDMSSEIIPFKGVENNMSKDIVKTTENGNSIMEHSLSE
ncbi:bromodomain-containing protein DDB_G0270170-like [Sitophilus oryzae]|uniref:Bromodomain-containing protein DDB_G0270170-like n=1 Tax=Sitophilus oryzae TaxID=7048 RepID=A0A6J2YF16_SITOR|nr:bromodomain-containing protein DDB_G0270170-like [Sitophilus oryzae]